MGRRTRSKGTRDKTPDRGRHERDCKVCNHPNREAIEREFVAWGEVTKIAKRHGVSRDSFYRHANALALFDKRSRNIRTALEQIIEKAGTVRVTAAAVVSAVQAYAKINAQGQWVERTEHLDLRAVFDRMSREELDAYARDGTLPAWFSEFAGATRLQSD